MIRWIHLKFLQHLFALLIICSCSVAVWAGDERLSVVTSIRPLALLVQDLAGDWVNVDVVVPPNADPHNMSLRMSSRQKIEDADLVLWLGPEFERFLKKPMAQRKVVGDIAVDSLNGIYWLEAEREEEHADEHHDHSHHGRDLHVWLNPDNAKVILQKLAQQLLILRPDLKVIIDARLSQVLKRVEQTSQAVEQKLKLYKGKSFGVYHDAYGHFVATFDLHTQAAVNQMPEQRLSAKRLHQLQQDMQGASCIVVERKSDKTQRLARVLHVGEVEADPLASDKAIKSYSDFLLYLGGAFEGCFKGT